MSEVKETVQDNTEDGKGTEQEQNLEPGGEKKEALAETNTTEVQTGSQLPNLTATEKEGEGQSQEEGKTEEKAEGGAPEAYERFSIELPEGAEYDEAMAAEYGTIAKELNLSQESANKLASFYGEKMKAAYAEQQRALADYQQSLIDQVMADPEIGGNNWAGKAEVLVKKAVSTFGGPELEELVRQNPILGCHPAFIKALHNAGKLLSEGSFVDHRAGDAGTKSTADVMFGDMAGVSK